MKTKIPEQERGDWKIERFTVTDEDEKWEVIRAIASFSGRYTPAGTYTRLKRNGATIMSDTPDEISDHNALVYHATGKVLINGLGLGIAAQMVLEKEEVEHVTIVEIDADVIAMVEPYLEELYGDRVEIIQADALTWTPPKGVRYNAVWHDIWDTICSDNLPEMHTLHRKYGRRTDWQASWCREICEMQRKTWF